MCGAISASFVAIAPGLQVTPLFQYAVKTARSGSSGALRAARPRRARTFAPSARFCFRASERQCLRRSLNSASRRYRSYEPASRSFCRTPSTPSGARCPSGLQARAASAAARKKPRSWPRCSRAMMCSQSSVMRS
ncbi:hypothetical protein GA0115246_114582 [Streptomyces sp. SolWspMP-sol7th]|nr:hypothetical protein GA0115246_114582 [Streptomyces sp. SolWspMP-sol7th]